MRKLIEACDEIGKRKWNDGKNEPIGNNQGPADSFAVNGTVPANEIPRRVWNRRVGVDSAATESSWKTVNKRVPIKALQPASEELHGIKWPVKGRHRSTQKDLWGIKERHKNDDENRLKSMDQYLGVGLIRHLFSAAAVKRNMVNQ